MRLPILRVRWLAPVLAAAVSLSVCGWMVSYGTGRFLAEESFGVYYDDQARSLSRGWLNVHPESIGGEAMIVNKKYYGYFGLGPALPRIFLNRLFPRMYGRWSRLSVLLAVLMHAVSLPLLLRAVSPSAQPSAAEDCFFLLVGTLGSTVLFLCTRSYIYHEAIIWSGALALWSYLLLLLYLRSGRLLPLLLACLLAVGTVLTRANTGLGPLAAAGLLAVVLALRPALLGPPGRSASARLPAAILLGAAVLGAGSQMTINFLKFGNPWDPMPLRFALQYTPERRASIDDSILHIGNLPFIAREYLSPANIAFRPSFPWIMLDGAGGNFDATRYKIDIVEPYASIPASMPALFVLALVGLAGMLRFPPEWRNALFLLCVSGLVGGWFIVTNAALTHRYLHDLYPFLVMTAAAGLGSLRQLQRPLWRR